MSVNAFDITKVEDYILKRDRTSDDPTIFHIGKLDITLRGYIEDMSKQFGISGNGEAEASATVSMNLSKKDIEAVRFGIKGWDNFQNSGVAVEFKTESRPTKIGPRHGLADKLLNWLQPYIDELAEVVWSYNFPSEELKKNSESPSG